MSGMMSHEVAAHGVEVEPVQLGGAALAGAAAKKHGLVADPAGDRKEWRTRERGTEKRSQIIEKKERQRERETERKKERETERKNREKEKGRA